MKTCAFYTLGCKVNQYETQSIREDFVKVGYRELKFGESCDVYVINTCTVTAKTDKESRRIIREVHRRNPQARIVVTGCYVECDEDEIRNMPCPHIIVRNNDKDKITDIIDSKGTSRCLEQPIDYRGYLPLTISDFKDRTKAFIKIQDGCDNFCSYCKVPLVRGHSRSRDIESILGEARRLIAKGFKEIVLAGICLGAWGKDLSPKSSLDELLERLIELRADFRVRLSSIEPKYVNARLISIMRTSRKLCKHLHIPFQSGDNEILKMMNRPYTVDTYIDIVEETRRDLPEVSITTDIMVGFPQETEANFHNTCRFLERIGPSRVHIFTYSRREGTAAASLSGEVPKHIAKKRFNRLKDLALRVSYDYRKNFLQKETEVLIEGKRDKETGCLKGYDDKYIKILLMGEDSYKCRIVPVKIQKVNMESTFGAIF